MAASNGTFPSPDSTAQDFHPKKASKQSHEEQDPFPRFATTETPELAHLSSSSDSDDATTLVISKRGGATKAKRKKARKRDAKQSAAATGSTSTPFLRPAADVLNRLRHDAAFKESDYIVGYTDRFTGLQTMNVQDWGNKDVEDEDFIAEHRIEYFKRVADDHVVWHRRDKIDEIFWTGRSGANQSQSTEDD